MPKFPQLFEPFIIPPVHLKNRITMAPLFTAYAHSDRIGSRLNHEHYKKLASGGVAVIIVANALAYQGRILSKHSLHSFCVDDALFLPILKKLAKTIKKEGAATVLQIKHGGRFSEGKHNG